MTLCPCYSGQPYTNCCEAFLRGESNPLTAEALMRSRYCAFTQGNVDYLVETHDHKNPKQLHAELTEYVNSAIQWLKLEVLDKTRGGKKSSLMSNGSKLLIAIGIILLAIAVLLLSEDRDDFSAERETRQIVQ